MLHLPTQRLHLTDRQTGIMGDDDDIGRGEILLQHVNKSVARGMLILVVLAAGILSLNAIFQFEGLQVATDGTYAAAFGTAGSSALVLLLLDIEHYGLTSPTTS